MIYNQPKIISVKYTGSLKVGHLQSDHYPHSHPENVSYEPNKYAVQKCRTKSDSAITISSDIIQIPEI
jgi:hypothetical protein